MDFQILIIIAILVIVWTLGIYVVCRTIHWLWKKNPNHFFVLLIVICLLTGYGFYKYTEQRDYNRFLGTEGGKYWLEQVLKAEKSNKESKR